MLARAMAYLDMAHSGLGKSPFPTPSRFAGERAGQGTSSSPNTAPQSLLSRETGEGRGGGLKGAVKVDRSAARKWS